MYRWFLLRKIPLGKNDGCCVAAVIVLLRVTFLTRWRYLFSPGEISVVPAVQISDKRVYKDLFLGLYAKLFTLDCYFC